MRPAVRAAGPSLGPGGKWRAIKGICARIFATTKRKVLNKQTNIKSRQPARKPFGPMKKVTNEGGLYGGGLSGTTGDCESAGIISSGMRRLLQGFRCLLS